MRKLSAGLLNRDVFFGCIAVLALLTLGSGAALAQPQVQIQFSTNTLKKIDISYSRKHAPKTFEMGSSFNDVGEAAAYIESLKAWDAQMTPSSTWRLAVILVETNIRNLSFRQRKSLQEYKNECANAYRRAKNLRLDATQRVNTLTSQTFNDVNRVISEFNSLRQEAVAAYGEANFRDTPPIATMVWYYEIRYAGRVYRQGPFANWDAMANNFNAVRRSYPSIVLLKYYAA